MEPKRIKDAPIDPQWVAVRFRDPAPHSMRAAVAGGLDRGAFATRVEVPVEKYTLFRVDGGMEEGAHSAVAALGSDDLVARSTLLRRVGENGFLQTDRVVVGFDPEMHPDPRAELQRMGYAVVDSTPESYLVRLGEREDPAVVADQIETNLSGKIHYAHPDYVMLGRHLPAPSEGGGTPSIVDVAAPTAEGTGPSDDDNDDEASTRPLCDPTGKDPLVVVNALDPVIPGPEAQGGIRVAVLDAGIDETHPDIEPALGLRFDAVENDFVQQPERQDAHGTACAGLIAGRGTPPDGVKGVSPGCTIMAARIFESLPVGVGFEFKVTAWAIGAAVDWAWKNGADVISNSWVFEITPSVSDALERARTEGRKGKGCVLVAGVGNSGGPVEYPASLDGVLGVGATNLCDLPKILNSDGEQWATCEGAEVDLAAPGVSLFSADNVGEAGANPSSGTAGNYAQFSGTSASTALVAGAAALVLSANPDLMEDQVREILRDSARKVPGLPTDAAGHNDRVGQGILDVAEAVRQAAQTAPRTSRKLRTSRSASATEAVVSPYAQKSGKRAA